MKLYIGNLDEKIQDNHLHEAFSEFGKVSSAKVIMDRYTNKSRGFGFIEMPDEEEAVSVIKRVNGSTWEGKVIVVKKAIAKENR
ncbi:MAG: RNA-binding protein [Bacteroidales bacterium]|nr:RNA-binding protein [Bacteroidales bacterium]